MAAIYAPIVRDTAISFEETPPTAEEVTGRIRRTLANHPWIVLESEGDVAGYAYGGDHRGRAAYRWSVETSVYVAAGARAQGVGRSLYETLLALLAAQGFRRAFAGITLPNAPSVAFHEALGFEPVGVYCRVGFKHGAWRDVGWWQRALPGAADGPPEADPAPFEAFRRTDDCRRILGGDLGGDS